jgi:hypothetical protein
MTGFGCGVNYPNENPRSHRTLGVTLYNARRYGDAIAADQADIAFEPSPIAYARRGESFYALGDFQSARISCEAKPDYWRNRQRELKTWISEEAGPSASIDALMAVRPISSWIRKLQSRYLQRSNGQFQLGACVAASFGMSAGDLEQFADAFEHREREVAQSIVREKRG